MQKITLKKTQELKQQFLDETFGKDVPKRNKRHYDYWLLKIGNLLADHREYMEVATKKAKQSGEFGDRFNLLYDQEYALENLRDDIQRWLWKRNWTFQDYQQQKLVLLNID